MKKYKIEHKISTLIHCGIMSNEEKPASFIFEGVEFSQWDFSHKSGWINDSWIASSNIEANNILDAINFFRNKLVKIIPRISLISQTYIEFINESYLIHDTVKDIAFFRYVKNTDSCGLMFLEKEEKALNFLSHNKDIPEEFYYYWNDAVNAMGYSSKLLVMFSAVESLTRKEGKKDIILQEGILGKDLSDKIFEPEKGLRHRLVHGEYLDSEDTLINYVDEIHKKIMSYFNKKVFMEDLLFEDVVQPQRHLFGNKSECKLFLKRLDGGNNFNIKDLQNEFDKNSDDLNNIGPIFQTVYNNDLTQNY
jgi:hypothetical protein